MIEFTAAELISVLVGVVTLSYMIAKDIFSNKK